MPLARMNTTVYGAEDLHQILPAGSGYFASFVEAVNAASFREEHGEQLGSVLAIMLCEV